MLSLPDAARTAAAISADSPGAGMPAVPMKIGAASPLYPSAANMVST